MDTNTHPLSLKVMRLSVRLEQSHISACQLNMRLASVLDLPALGNRSIPALLPFQLSREQDGDPCEMAHR